MTAAEKKSGNTGHEVFISYSNEGGDSTPSDRQVADQICTALEAQNIRCWIAHRDILPGEDWLNAIIDAVEESKLLVLIFSSNSEKSEWVKDEVKIALDKKMKIIPIRIEDVYPRQSLRILKVRCQWLDAYTLPLEKHIERLIKTVSGYLGKEPLIPIKKEKLKKQPKAPVVKTVNKDVKAAKDKTKTPADMPEDVKKVISTAHKVDKNKNLFWEAYYKEYDITMIYIPPGEFIMGQTEEEKKWIIDQLGKKDYNSYYKNETPLHKVYLDGYWLGRNIIKDRGERI